MSLGTTSQQDCGPNPSVAQRPETEQREEGTNGLTKARRYRPGTWWAFYATAAGILILDQISKLAIVARMNEGQSQPIGGPYLSLTVHHNPGAAFGLFATGTVGLAILAAVVTVILVLYGPWATRFSPWLSVALGLTLGGAAGNLVDRVRLGYVIDFIDVHFWPVFNVADIAISCGAIMLVLSVLRGRRRCAMP